MGKSKIEVYKDYVSEELGKFTLLFQKYALGDFSTSVDIPKKENEFTELQVGLALMVDDIREMIREKENIIKNLQEMENKYRTLFENANEAILVAQDLEWKFCNPRAEQLFGYSQKELSSQPLTEFIHKEDRGIVKERHQKRISGENPPSVYNFRILDKNRNIKWVELNVAIIEWMERPATLCFLKDITDRKHAEAVVRASEKRWQSIIENAAIGIYQVTDQGKFTLVNPMLARIFGFKSPDDFLSIVKNISELYLRPEDRLPILHEMNSKGFVDGAEAQFRHKDGRTIWIKINARVIKDTPGKIIYEGFMSDITDVKLAQKASQESELWVRNIFKSLNESVFVITPDRIFLDMNEAAQKMFGYTKKELLNVSSEIVHVDHEHHLKFGKKMKEVIHKGEITDFQFKMRRKNGGIFPSEHTASLMADKEGNPIGIVSVIRDLSEQKKMGEEKTKLEAQLQQAQKMEAIGTLAGGIAHDFNNLLMGIQGHTSLMLIKIDPSHPHFRHLMGIEDNVKSAADLTRQLLGFARGGKYEVKPVNLNSIVNDSSEIFGRTKKEITIHREVQKELWTVEVDQTQIEQVLLNLYVNAWQAMSGTGKLHLKTKNVTLDEIFVKRYGVKPGRYVKISVADTGIGMDKATQQKIFDPFFTTKEKSRGTGLGLASAYGIIKNHDGLINVYSEIGKGATFNIYLPTSEKEMKKEKEISGEVIIGTETILLIDDEEMIIEVGRELLESLGYTVLSSKSGKEAIAIYQKDVARIDGVILDMIMPVMGGSETYDRLKAINPDIRVLLSSGYSINGLAKTILAKGCNGFIQKPFSLKDLSQKLREILDIK